MRGELFFLMRLYPPILIPYHFIRVRVRKWWLHRQHLQRPPIFQLFGRDDGFRLKDLEQLIASGADVNARERKGGCTPLILAAWQDSPWNKSRGRWLEVCRVLLEGGADPNADYACGEMRRSPIYFAYLEGNVELLDLLLQAGANPRSEAWLHFIRHRAEPLSDDWWVECQRPEIRDRLRRWKSEQDAKHLDAVLPNATDTVLKSRARL